MHIVFGIDDNFAMPCGVLIKSIMWAEPNTEITFHVLTETLSEHNKKLLSDLLDKPNYKIEFYYIKSVEVMKTFPIVTERNLSTYYRFFIPFMLSESISKALYFDSDMVVVDSLADLWDTEIADVPVAASIDNMHDDIRFFNRLDYNSALGYYNAGMLLMNLDYWRKNRISEKCFDYIQGSREKCVLQDQDALNHVLAGNIKRLHTRYNILFLEPLEIYPVNNKFFPEIYEALNSPVIIHYTGRIKPWHKDCSTPYKKIWLFVKSQTVWKNKKLKHSDPKIIISSIFQLLKNIILVLFGRNVFDKSKGTLLHLFGRSVFEKLNVICKKSDIADSDYITNIEEIMKKISRYAYKDSEKERDLHGNTN